MSFPAFESATRAMQFELGEGLPGRVWKSGHASCIDDVARDGNFPRARVATSEGLHGAFGFPIVLGNETLGVLEFFSREPRTTDESVLHMFEKLGQLLGQFLGRERREIERAALLARESTARVDAENANRLKDEFLATLSHELRTPLNAILGWTHLLSEEALDKKGIQRAIETIRRNVRLQDQIISDILDVSRITAGKIRLELQNVPLDTGVGMVLDSLRPTADAKKVTLTARYESPGLVVRGDPRRIEQILWNLVSNAIKYVPEGGRVEVTLRRRAPARRSGSSTTGRGSIPRSFRTSSSGSARRTPRARAPTGGSAWALRSCATSPRCTGVRSRRTTARTEAVLGSACVCPPCGRPRSPPRGSTVCRR
jgi:hypothetical protein